MVLLSVTGVPWAAEPSGSWLAESLVLNNSFGGLVYKSRKVKLSLPRITNDDLICTTKNLSWRRSYFVPRITVVALKCLGFSSTVGLGNGAPLPGAASQGQRGDNSHISLPWSGPFSLRQVRCASVGSATELARYGTGSESDRLPDMRGIGKLGLRPGHSEDKGTGYSGLTQFGW